MAQFYSTGPVQLYVGPNVGAGFQPVFLGYGRRAPVITGDAVKRPVYCDLGGDAPLDQMYSGETATVQVDLNYWNEPVLQVIRDRGKVAGQPATPGHQGPLEVGTLMVMEGVGYPLWLVYPYRAKPAYAAMPPGYMFYRASLAPDREEGGTRSERVVHLVWDCMRLFNASTFALDLWTADPAAFVGLPPPI
jgi:hypothetical protein